MLKFIKKYAHIIIPVALAAALVFVPTAVKEGRFREQMALGERFMFALDYKSAALAYERATEVDPKRIAAWTALADAYTALGDNDSALDALRRGWDATADAGIRTMYESLGGGELGVSESRIAEIPLPWLEEALREYFDRPEGPISLDDLTEITELIISGDNIYINGLDVNSFELGDMLEIDARKLADFCHKCPNLYFLDICMCDLSSLAPLSELTQLQYLYLRGNGISDIAPITGMTWLTHLDLGENQLTDISGIENLLLLESVSLTANMITDISPLAELKYLEIVELYENPITDYSPVDHVPEVGK
ncbi:MAG: leucine-rich repeat domain-containing protein [Clostridia bacterium]|nr:leucine-rich repeat domain-containing protein [Clostridia bacterium]